MKTPNGRIATLLAAALLPTIAGATPTTGVSELKGFLADFDSLRSKQASSGAPSSFASGFVFGDPLDQLTSAQRPLSSSHPAGPQRAVPLPDNPLGLAGSSSWRPGGTPGFSLDLTGTSLTQGLQADFVRGISNGATSHYYNARVSNKPVPSSALGADPATLAQLLHNNGRGYAGLRNGGGSGEGDGDQAGQGSSQGSSGSGAAGGVSSGSGSAGGASSAGNAGGGQVGNGGQGGQVGPGHGSSSGRPGESGDDDDEQPGDPGAGPGHFRGRGSDRPQFRTPTEHHRPGMGTTGHEDDEPGEPTPEPPIANPEPATAFLLGAVIAGFVINEARNRK